MKKILAILVACVVGFAAVGCGSNSAVAEVNDVPITVEQFEQQLKFTKFISELQYGDTIWETMKAQNPNYQDMVKNQVLDQMIKEREFISYAEKNRVKPDEAQLKSFKEQNKKLFSNKETKEKFEKAGLTEKFMDEYAQKQAKIAGLSKYLMKKAEPSEKQMKEYFEKNNTKLDASHILIATTDSKTGKPMNEKQKAEAKKLAEQVYEKAKSGEDFSKLAKEYSQDPGSKEQGGKLGVFGKGAMVPQFEKVAFSLKEGEISKPVETQFGYHIIKLNKIVKQKFDEMKPQIKQELIQKNMQSEIQKIEKDAKVKKYEDRLKEIPFGPTAPAKKEAPKKDSEKKSEPKANSEKKDEPKKEEKK